MSLREAEVSLGNLGLHGDCREMIGGGGVPLRIFQSFRKGSFHDEGTPMYISKRSSIVLLVEVLKSYPLFWEAPKKNLMNISSAEAVFLEAPEERKTVTAYLPMPQRV